MMMLHHHKFVLCVRECVCVRKAAELHLEEERKSLRVKYRPVGDLLSSDQFTSQCGESCQDHHHKEDADERHQFLCQLPAQCGVARSWKDTSPERWVKAVHGLPPEPLKFALSASLGTLPTNANLHTWGKKTRDTLQPVHGTPAVSHPYPQQLPCCNGTSEVQSKT